MNTGRWANRAFGLTLAALLACAALARADDAADDVQVPQAKPGEQHKLLAKEAGVWDVVMKVFPGPGLEPLEFKGVERNRVIAGGLWVQTEFKADFLGGKKYIGHGVMGYDPAEKKFVGSWADNYNTHLSRLEGEYNPKTKSLIVSATARMPGAEDLIKHRHVTRFVDDNKKIFTVSMPIGDGKYFKIIEITAKRRKKR